LSKQWWRTNRPDSPDLFAIDLENGFRLISAHPGIGALAVNANLEGVRRVHLARVHYHLYYRVTTARDSSIGFVAHQPRKRSEIVERRALASLLRLVLRSSLRALTGPLTVER